MSTRKNISIKTRREKIRKFLNEIKTVGCSLCGYSACLAAIEFHHVTGDKSFEINQLSGYSIERVKKEMEKCVVVCANCHRQIHSNQGWNTGKASIKENKKDKQLNLFD